MAAKGQKRYHLNWVRSSSNLVAFLRGNVVALITLGLAAQECTAFGSNPRLEALSKNSISGKLLVIPSAQLVHQPFVNETSITPSTLLGEWTSVENGSEREKDPTTFSENYSSRNGSIQNMQASHRGDDFITFPPEAAEHFSGSDPDPNNLTKKSEKLQQQIRGDIDQINSALQGLALLFRPSNAYDPDNQRFRHTAITRFSRSTPRFQRRSQCTVSKDKLIGLEDELTHARSIAHGMQNKLKFRNYNNCELDSSTRRSEDCNESIGRIQCGMIDLQMATLKVSAKEDEVNSAWKSRYQDLLEHYNKDIDNVNSTVFQEHQKIVDDLVNRVQTHVRSLTAALTELKETRDKLKIKTLAACIAELGNGKVVNAKAHFLDLDDDSKLPDIIKSVYDGYGNLTQVKNILNFVKDLPWCQRITLGYPALLDAMKENGNKVFEYWV